MNTMTLFLLVALLACPALALLLNCIVGRKKAVLGARWATCFIGFSLVIGLALLGLLQFYQTPTTYLLINFNTLGLLLCTLILFVSFIVHRFSIRYMDGDRLYSRYFVTLAAITLSAVVMVLADNLFLFWFSWSLSNLLLILLMVHKKKWLAAKNSGWLALNALLPGSLSLLIAFIVMSTSNNTASIQVLIEQPNPMSSFILFGAMGLLTFAALIQSANWPFHRWFISSLNSPTPVSALMHAGLVNGGGILIVKFAPLFAMHKSLLTVLFIFGAISSFLGTFWKLMQSDIKRMLACSTLAQMGFMMMQCGLGLFAAAIAHLCWHGLFKAYLFLSSGSAVAQKRYEHKTQTGGVIPLLVSCIGGLLGMLAFAYMTSKPIFSLQATSFVLVFAFIAGTQLMLTLINNNLHLKRILAGLFIAGFTGLLYGGSIHLIELLIPNLTQFYLPKLSLLHALTLALFLVPWVLFNLGLLKKLSQSRLWCWLYMNLMNASQPDAKTITTSRSDYQY